MPEQPFSALKLFCAFCFLILVVTTALGAIFYGTNEVMAMISKADPIEE